MPANAILLVEDDGILCADIEDMLTLEGHGVMDVLPSGETALELVKEQQPDLIIMDIKLTGELDGISTVKQIIKNLDVPVIYMTAYADDTLIRRARETAPYAYLVKPVQERELIATIEMALYRHSLERKLKQTEATLRQSEEKYRCVVKVINEGVILQLKTGEIIAFNESAENILGIPAADVIGKTSTSYNWSMIREDGSAFPEELHPSMQSLNNRKPLKNVVMGYKRKDENIVWINVNTNPIFKQGETDPYAVVISFSDITERKLAEQKLADYTLELEQLYHHLDAELDKARQMHERTLPTTLPTVEGISFAAHYQPALKMGGDFYDVIHKDNKLIFYLSDVSGHGLDGAMLSIFIKEAIYSYINLKPDDISPYKILQHLSRQYGRENYDEELYFCIFIAVLDLGTLELSYCGAGFQEKLLLQLGNGERLALASSGLFITSYLPAEMLTLEDQAVIISPGTTIFCNTDGLTEQRVQGTYYRDRLPDVFFQNAHLPPGQVVKAVLDDFRRFNNGSLQCNDDITFLVLWVNK